VPAAFGIMVMSTEQRRWLPEFALVNLKVEADELSLTDPHFTE
jgi:hypothetical protein